jgi:ParB-like chromosome segregation protein Spo0J
MQYQTVDPTLPLVVDVFGQSMADADETTVASLADAMRADGFDATRPVILVVNQHSLETTPFRWNSNHEVMVAQGRHRWLAALEAGVDVAAILVSHDEWSALGEHGDADEVEVYLAQRLAELVAADGEDVQI